jgi:hypothetical protein
LFLRRLVSPLWEHRADRKSDEAGEEGANESGKATQARGDGKCIWFKPVGTRIEKLTFTRQEWKVLEDSELKDSEPKDSNLKELGWDHFVKAGKLTFTRQEWKVLEDSELKDSNLKDSNLKELGWDHFVKAGHTYFKPGARGAIVTPRHFCFWLAWMVSQASTRKRPIPRLTSTLLDATPHHHLHRGCSGSWSSRPS